MSIRKVVPIADAEWRIESAPAWVVSREPDWEFTTSDEHAFAFLLTDEQHDVATQSVYSRSVRRLLTHAAVQALGQVEIEFDPAAHRLLIHELTLRRKTAEGPWEARTEAQRSDFLLRQREQQLEQQMLNGRVSLVALLEDVRVGDAIDLSWTLEPREPLPGLRFTTFYAVGWNAPVARASLSLLQDPSAPVTWRVHAPEGVDPPEETVAAEGVTWEARNQQPLTLEPNAPGSHWPCAVIDVSAWSTWGEVASFLAALWAEALAEGAEAIAAEAARLKAEHDGAALIREAIRFVQEDIRYLSIDFGHGAGMLPSGSGTVLRRRFGDCKDKSVLLAALLRALGFEASPILVAANWTTAVRRTQPSTSVFSHAIVGFAVDGESLFVDPTLIGQGGDLAHRTPPPYGYGLEVREGTEDLVAFPEASIAELSVTEIFDLDHSQHGGTVEQVMEARGALADDIRAALVREGASAFAKARATALQAHFPALVPGDEPAAVVDDLDENVIEVRSRHALPTWGAVGQKTPDTFNYGAHGLFYAVEYTEGPDQRKQPWVLRHPLQVRHRVVVRGKGVRKVKVEHHRIRGVGFRYDCDIRPGRREATFDFRWETTQGEIAPGEWADYCNDRGRALAVAGANVPTKLGPAPWQWALGAVGGVALGLGLAHLSEQRAQDPGSGVEAASVEPERIEAAMADARRAIERGDHRSALEILATLEPHYSRSHGFHFMRAEAAIRSGRFDAAREAIATAQAIDPTNIAVELQVARVAEATGDPAAARAAAGRVLEREPGNFAALWLSARSAQQLGDTAGARRAWELLLSKHPGHADSLLAYASLLWNLGERQQADSAIEGAVRAQPVASPSLEAALSSYYDATGRPAAAVGPAQRAAALAPDDPRFANRYALALLRAGDGSKAFAEAHVMVDRFPSDPLALSALAIIASTTGRDDVAAQAFDRWRQAEPGNPNAAASYGYYLHRTGRSEKARVVLEQATRDHPTAGVVWLNYANALAALGDLDSAAAARERADALLTDRERATLIR